MCSAIPTALLFMIVFESRAQLQISGDGSDLPALPASHEPTRVFPSGAPTAAASVACPTSEDAKGGGYRQNPLLLHINC